MRPSMNYMPPEQLDTLIENIPSLCLRKWSDTQVAMLFKIMYWCGLRIGEALRLHAEDFELDEHRVYLGHTKTVKNDRITVPDRFVDELTVYLADKTGPLFEGMNYHIVYRWLMILGKSLNILALTTPQKKSGEKTKTHIFRKSVGKDMLYGTHDKQRIPLNVVQKKLRHSNLDTTSKYLQADDEDVAALGW